MLITHDPDDLEGLDRLAARAKELDHPYMLDSILAPINSGFAASLARYVEVRRRHPGAELLMGIGNLTELTEADTTGVTALLIGFCQEVGIGAVLTTEVIGWAQGAVRATVLAAQMMHLAQRQARPPKHIDSGLVTSRDESMRAPSEEELRAMQSQISDPNYRLFADAEWLYAFNGDRFVREANMYAVFDQLDVADPVARVLPGQGADEGDDRARAAQELSPGGTPGLGPVQLPGTSTRGHAMKKILVQLDTDQHPSAFDAIAAYDADVDVVLGFGAITADNLADTVQGAIFPRGPDGLANTAFWVGGSKVRDGEAVFEAAQQAVLQTLQRVDHARLRRLEHDRRGRGCARSRRSDVEGQQGGGDRRRARRPADGRAAAPRGRRRDDADVPARRDGGRPSPRIGHPGRAGSGLRGRRARLQRRARRRAGRPRGGVRSRPGRRADPAPQRLGGRRRRLQVVVDYSAAEPVGVEGVDRGDSLEEEDGVKKLGALAVGGPKMKLQKRCVQRMFESKGTVMDLEGVYEVALEVLVSADYLENTNLPIGPSSGLSSSGRHRIVSSILRASVKSLSVIPPAECVANFTQSLPQVTLRSA